MKHIEGSSIDSFTGLLLTPEDKERAIAEAEDLLVESEEEIPPNVMKVIEFCSTKRIGFVLSRNTYAGNCRDARSKRYRLGHIGIPLYDEMKSIIGSAKDANGNIIIIAMHCRGHMAIDFKRVSQLCEMQTLVTSLPENELLESFGMKFGTVNPILLDLNSNERVLNVFDSGLLKPMSRFPGTMMTNAGDHTWGIELDPRDLITSTKNKVVGAIAIRDVELQDYELPHLRNPKTIGIITGNGPDSGIALWQDINEHFVEILGPHFLGDISLPKISVMSVPAMGLSMELDRREQPTWEALSEVVTKFKNQRVDLLALACHTTHYFTDRIRSIFDGDGQRFISMADVVMHYVQDNNINDLAILGIDYVADLGQWSAYSKLREYRVEELSAETLRKFHKLGYEVKRMSQLHKSFRNLIGLIKNEVKSNNVIIALTELSILLQSQSKKERSGEKNIIDALELYAKAIAKASLRVGE